MSQFTSPSPQKDQWEKTAEFTPRFSVDGLITAIATDVSNGQILMVAHMNEQALALSMQTGIAHYWSRSRGKIWKKGESSGSLQSIEEMRTDCDQDVIILSVSTAGTGANCHTGRKSCFYRIVQNQSGQPATLIFDDNDEPLFDPSAVYG